MLQPYDLPLEQLKKYKPELTREHDFNEFWSMSLKELSAVPLHYTLTPINFPVKGVKVFSVNFTGFNNSNIQGYFAIPDKPGKYPGLMLFHGYNWCFDGNIGDTVNWALHGYAAFQMLTRGQQGYSSDNVISSAGSPAGWMTKGILNPKEYYYRAVYLDAVRALEILASFDNVDAEKIGVHGGSQGGGLTLASAALSDIPAVAVADYPFLSNFERAIDVALSNPFNEINEFFRRNTAPEIEIQAKKTLSYFDIMNLAPDIKCHTWVSAGLVDDIVPPSTVFAAYNHMVCSKEISVHRYFGHEYIPATVVPKLSTLMEYLQD
ncbi:cephalosporin-C deacetylase [Ruminiclostridium sufflavum DSM 19573]|uniref:Cephalosporin-C deacetylase n=1 Tax=Ruminiclostridium sufflavum DSM 19573 TaxID=1121337 RepID=A0A318XMI5_9FIRM|nr:acetylxylan esterase [Ruminiclostridium sufflavum]PYG87142.1 cephalosporin-C deacetylase [Ruminiclostridium sufflavum DSM 19573]